ncbi:MAG: hypothetical protein EP329_01345 [Deltaproteobacteria bacterium]|nr:MAG: hypothetical protein EP329_01345 [Deltaproteobacteria bacterium]
MNWHLTWQDPVALALVVLSILFSRWLSRRLQRAGCAKCNAHELAAPTPEPRGPRAAGKMVALERLRIGSR